MIRISIFGEKGRNFVFPKPSYVMCGTCTQPTTQGRYSIEPIKTIECKIGWKKGHQVLLPKDEESDPAPQRKRVIIDTNGQMTILNEYGKVIRKRTMKIRPRKRIEVEMERNFDIGTYD